jgi:hypothetical protein
VPTTLMASGLVMYLAAFSNGVFMVAEVLLQVDVLVLLEIVGRWVGG